jgi:hypothetical protein
VGPCHQIGDTIIHVPKEKVVFAGDVIFRECTPMGWNGTYEKWLKVLDLIISLDPEVIVPGHGPVCGIEGAMEMKAYLEYVREESKRCFGQGLSALEASKKIDFGPYGGWKAPARLFMNVDRAYREFRNEATDAPWDHAKVFDAVLAVAKAKGSRSSSDWGARFQSIRAIPGNGMHENQTSAAGETEMKFPRIYSDEQGETHIGVCDRPEHEAPFGPPPTPMGLMTDIEGVSSLVMFSVPGGTEVPAHNAPQPYICIVLSGEGEVTASDRSTLRLGPGGLLYCDDVSGKGHVTRSITDLSLAFINRASS